MNLKQYISVLKDKEVDEKRKAGIMAENVRAAFSTDSGQITLAVLLQQLGYTKKAETAEAVALKNFGTYIVSTLLGFTPEKVVESMMKE